MAEFTTTQRGARSLLYGGYSYMINRRGRDDIIYWRCTRSRNCHCTGSVTTGPGDVVVAVKNTHNHRPIQPELEAKKIVSSLKERAGASLRPVPVLYQEEVQKSAASSNFEEVAAQLPTLAAVKSALYRRRRKLIPPLPTTRADVHFDGEWVETFRGAPFLLAEDGVGDDKVVIFATADNLQRLAEADTVFVDGTFGTCPRLFYQIFTLHATANGRHVPLVYCLLPNKQQATYERVFQILEEKVRVDLQLDLLPSSMLSDFELAIMNAARAVFPGTSTKGCYFHFCQAILRKVQQLGLQTEYTQNGELRTFIRKVAALALVPLRYVRLGWMGVKASAPSMPQIEEFIDYFGSTWLTGNYPPAV